MKEPKPTEDMPANNCSKLLPGIILTSVFMGAAFSYVLMKQDNVTSEIGKGDVKTLFQNFNNAVQFDKFSSVPYSDEKATILVITGKDTLKLDYKGRQP